MLVVSFTTSPSRMLGCTAMVRSILEQTHPPDLFILNVPDTFGRTGEKYVVPSQLSRRLHINRCGRDWGPGTKLVPTIDYLKSNNYPPSTRIVVIDDDVCYQPTLLAGYISTDPTVAWTLQGLITPEDLPLPTKKAEHATVSEFYAEGKSFFLGNKQRWSRNMFELRHNMPCDILEAWASFCVTLEMFKDDFMPYMRAAMESPLTKFADDVTFSNYLAKQGVSRRIFSSDETNVAQLRPYVSGVYGDDALQMGGAEGETNLVRYVRLLHEWEATGDNYLMNGRKKECLQD